MGKRRFGVSLPEELVERLDDLASRLGTSRSSLIQSMLIEVIEDRSHLLRPHRCKGVLVVVSDGRRSESVASVLERFGRCVISRTHHHIDNVCVDVSFVEGDSSEILELEGSLRRIGGVSERYLPVDCAGRGRDRG